MFVCVCVCASTKHALYAMNLYNSMHDVQCLYIAFQRSVYRHLRQTAVHVKKSEWNIEMQSIAFRLL